MTSTDWARKRYRLAGVLALLVAACSDAAATPAPSEGQPDAGERPGTDAGTDASDPFEATVVPSQNGTRLTLGFGGTLFEVDPNGAGRIVTFSLEGVNVLVTAGNAWGSVLWPSPQSTWPDTWPPPPEFDSTVYTASTEGNVIVMSGTTTSAAFGSLRATKRFWANAAHGVVTLEYAIHNDGTALVSVAPWENSRVNPGGLVFFPEAAVDRVAFGSFSPVPLTSSQGAGWFEYRSAQISSQYKSGADAAEGWAAHVDCHATLERQCTGARSPVFIKSFPDVSKSEFAPGEAEIEIYADSSHAFVEFENQGSYLSIPAGGQRTWRVHWYLRPLPDGISLLTGNTQLLEFVRGELHSG